MNRLERILQHVKREYSEDGKKFTAIEVAEALGIWRNDASKDLNILVREGILGRTPTRPVCFYLNPTTVTEKHEESPKAEAESKSEAFAVHTDAAERAAGNREEAAAEPAGEVIGEAPIMPAAILNANASDSESTGENPENPEDAFADFIGNYGSLRLQIETAKAATVYPEYGLHTLIIGETGVGKTTLARCMHKHMKLAKKDPNLPFISFNCAEYADNPQLLLAQLFGYEKGAFTGANSRKEGLISQANGGVLFLDEIHRLTPVGQEMFFSVIDHGVYRRLGGNSLNTANLMIIGATTENISSSLLMTFNRRFPMTISLPALDERPVSERLDMIMSFFLREGSRFSRPIWVAGSVVQMLLNYKGNSNIGHLKNAIQICCARGYFRMSSEADNSDTIKIEMHDLPRDIVAAYQASKQVSRYCEMLFQKEYLIFRPGDTIDDVSSQFNQDIYWMTRTFTTMYALDHNSLLSGSIRELISVQSDTGQEIIKKIIGAIPTRYLRFSELLMDTIGRELKTSYQENSEYLFAYMLYELVNYAKGGRAMTYEYFSEGSLVDTPEVEHLGLHAQEILEEFGVELTKGELSFLSLVLCENYSGEEVPEQTEDPIPKKSPIRLLIALRGETRGQDTVDFINESIQVDFVRNLFIDARKNDKEAAEMIAEELNQESLKGAVVLTNVYGIYEKGNYQREVHCPVQVLSKCNALLAMEVARQINHCVETEENIELLFSSVNSISFIGGIQLPSGLLKRGNKNKKQK